MIIGLDYYKETYNVFSETIIRPGLDNMKRAMQFLKEPQFAYDVIHVAGTNGKGSTVMYMKELAQAHNLKVGTFMSPGIIDVHDQIQIDGKPITREQLANVFKQLHESGLSGLCTDFELLTCAAFVHFRNEAVDIALIEAGLGGRFDSTNVVQPKVSIITSISLEHTNFLGDTITSIAEHKAGIMKQGAVAIIGLVDDEARTVFEQEACTLGVTLERFDEDFQVVDGLYEDEAFRISVCPSMLGQHQLHNAALAIRAMGHIVSLQEELVKKAINKASLPFRFERITDSLYFDGAHNPASVDMLIQLIKQYWPNESVQFVVGMLADKDVKQVLKLLEQVSDDFVFVNFENTRAMKADQLMLNSHAKVKTIEHDAVNYLIERAKGTEKTVVTGSLYLLASLREAVLHQL